MGFVGGGRVDVPRSISSEPTKVTFKITVKIFTKCFEGPGLTVASILGHAIYTKRLLPTDGNKIEIML